ncbi:MAG: hypothetical protein HY590_07345 [Candidatus Omnitrophica bacterium]|nr:hypothetical protein [Candidatus Omnitrophota bacterium]
MVELLIATTLLLVAITGLLAAFRSPAPLNEMARDTTIAVQDGSRIIEEMRVTTFSNIQGTNWDTWATNNGAKNLLPISETGEQVVVTYTTLDASLLEIKIQINWSRRSRSRNVRLTTRIANVGTS